MPPPTSTGMRSGESNASSSSHRSARANKDKPMDLLCRVRYSNTLPDIPFEPKFIACTMDLQRFVEYKQTSLEKNYRYDILTEADMGVKIDLINPDTYSLDPEEEVKMDPLDEKLLEDEPATSSDSKRSRQHNKIVPWMRKTEYISSEFNRFGTSSERQETKLGYNIKKRLSDSTVYRDRNSQIKAINDTFHQVQTPVTQHYSKPGVYAIQELPVLPDFDLWKYPFAQVIFDADPAQAGQQQAVQMAKMSQALIRGMMDDSGEQFVAYFLPTDETLDKRHGEEEDQAQEFDYKLHREYNWTVKNKASKGYEENYLIVLRNDGAYYDELETRVRLSRRRREGQARIGNSRLIVSYRPQNESELAAQENRMQQLQSVVAEEEEEVVQTEKEQSDNEESKKKEDKEIGEQKSRKRESDDSDNQDRPPNKKSDIDEDEDSDASA